MQKKDTKKILLIAALLAMALCATGMLAGCGGSGGTSPHSGFQQGGSTGGESAGETENYDGAVEPEYYGVEDNVDDATNEGVGTLTAYSTDGTALWTAQTDAYPMTELSKTYDIGLMEDGYCVEAGGTVYCFDKVGGALLWKNSDFQGATSACSIGADGNIYLCGYYGPMLYVITPDGKTLSRCEKPLFRSSAYDPDDYYWPTELAVYDEYVTIKFDSNGQMLYIVPETGQSEFEPDLLISQ